MSRFFDKLRNGMARFMYGRNGADALNWAIFFFFLLILVLSALVAPMTTRVWVYTLFNALSFALAVVYIFRAFSRNLDKRRAENARFLQWWTPKRQAVRNWNFRRRDREHCYIKCRHCGTRLRLPRGKGKIQVTCPKCHETTITRT